MADGFTHADRELLQTARLAAVQALQRDIRVVQSDLTGAIYVVVDGGHSRRWVQTWPDFEFLILKYGYSTVPEVWPQARIMGVPLFGPAPPSGFTMGARPIGLGAP